MGLGGRRLGLNEWDYRDDPHDDNESWEQTETQTDNAGPDDLDNFLWEKVFPRKNKHQLAHCYYGMQSYIYVS